MLDHGPQGSATTPGKEVVLHHDCCGDEEEDARDDGRRDAWNQPETNSCRQERQDEGKRPELFSYIFRFHHLWQNAPVLFSAR